MGSSCAMMTFIFLSGGLFRRACLISSSFRPSLRSWSKRYLCAGESTCMVRMPRVKVLSWVWAANLGGIKSCQSCVKMASCL